MQASLIFPGHGRFRSASQRRFVMVRWSTWSDKAVIIQRSDTLSTLATAKRKHGSDVLVFDTTTGQVVA